MEPKRISGQEVSTGKLGTGKLRTPFSHISGQSDLYSLLPFLHLTAVQYSWLQCLQGRKIKMVSLILHNLLLVYQTDLDSMSYRFLIESNWLRLN